MNQNYTPKDGVLVVEVVPEWLEAMKHAIFMHPVTQEWTKIAWIEPLVDSGRYRLMFAPAGASWILPNQVDGNMFSKN